jgi:hypothetical protein
MHIFFHGKQKLEMCMLFNYVSIATEFGFSLVWYTFFVLYKLDTYFTKVGMYEHEFVLFKHNALICKRKLDYCARSLFHMRTKHIVLSFRSISPVSTKLSGKLERYNYCETYNIYFRVITDASFFYMEKF